MEKLDRLGSGASGTVFKARHVPSNTLVALKQINAMDSETRKQILNEMRTLCDNPNAPGLVKFYGAYYVADSAQARVIDARVMQGKKRTKMVTVLVDVCCIISDDISLSLSCFLRRVCGSCMSI